MNGIVYNTDSLSHFSLNLQKWTGVDVGPLSFWFKLVVWVHEIKLKSFTEK